MLEFDGSAVDSTDSTRWSGEFMARVRNERYRDARRDVEGGKQFYAFAFRFPRWKTARHESPSSLPRTSGQAIGVGFEWREVTYQLPPRGK